MNSFANVVYLTRTEQVQLYGIGFLALACLVGAIAVDLFGGRT